MKKHLPKIGVGVLLLAGLGLGYQYADKGVELMHGVTQVQEDESWTPEQLWQQEFSRKKTRREAGYAKADKPSEYTLFQQNIRTKWGDKAPTYAAGYRIAEFNKAVAKSANHKAQVLDWVERGPGNVPGRIRGLLVLPGDANTNTWLAGSVAGGIWKTTDGGQSWISKTPDLPNLATTSLALSESNPSIIYAGTGESFAGYNGVNGDGILKSTDGGETWLLLTATAASNNFRNINRLIVSPQDANIILAATSTSYWNLTGVTSKIMKSTDGGTTWRKVFESPNDIEQIISQPSDFNIQYAAVNGIGVLKSVNGGETWLSTGPMSIEGRLEIAIAPSDPLRIYVSAEGSQTGTGSDLMVSDNGGREWRLVTSSTGATAYDFLGGQGWYDNTLAVNPFDKDEVYVAGVNMFKVRMGKDTQSDPDILGVQQNNTNSFLDFVGFNQGYFDGKLAKGKALQFAEVEIRFGTGKKQKAHRFTVPETGGTNSDGGAGIPAESYAYQDYVEVPFEAWDVTNNRQLMVSFRDQQGDGQFNLKDRQFSGEQLLDNREYVYIHNIIYSETSASSNIAKPAGQEHEQMYFFWPTLTANATWNPQGLPESAFVINYGARLSRDRTVTLVCDAYGTFYGPNGFAQTTNASSVTGVHPDHHNIIMVPVNATAKTFKVIVANDGGVFASAASTTPGVSNGDWRFAGQGLNTTQFYGIDKRPGTDQYIGGTQDNGTWRTPNGIVSAASTGYLRALGGDGFEVVWNYDDPNKMMGTIYYNAIYRSLNGGGNWSKSVEGITDAESGKAPFITKLGNHKSRPDVVFALGQQGVWRTEDFGAKWTLSPIMNNWLVGSYMDVEISIANPNIVWAGAGMIPAKAKLHVSTDGGKTFTPTQNYDTQKLGVTTGIFTHPLEDKTAFALFSFSNSPKVLKTTDLGKTWVDISGFEGRLTSSKGFPDVAVYSLIVMPHNPDQIWVGSEIGLIESLDGGDSWHMANNGLPNVSIWDMKAVDQQIIVGTHGRGIWTVNIPELPSVVRSPLIKAVSQTSISNLEVTVQMRSDYDSAVVIINGNPIERVKNVSKDQEISIPVNYQTKYAVMNVKVIGYQRWVDYPSKETSVSNVLGFEDDVKLDKLALSVYPNPAAEVANIYYYLPKATDVTLKVYDLTGRVIDTFKLGKQQRGEYKFPYAFSQGTTRQQVIIELKTQDQSRTFKVIR